jgi:hypothetical protein
LRATAPRAGGRPQYSTIIALGSDGLSRRSR